MQRYLSILLLLCVSCSTTKPTTTTNLSSSADFEKLTDDLLYGSLALSPVSAGRSVA